MADEAALAGLRVVEVAAGTTLVGAGMAASAPGALLRDLGADVTRVQSSSRPTLDAGIAFGRSWDHGKDVVHVDDDEITGVAASLASDADVLLICGSEDRVERRGLVRRELERRNPRLVQVRIQPGHNALGPLPDLELLVAARAGLLTQIRHRQPGRPVFPDLRVAQAGAALSATVGALARLYERERTGIGGWVETSLYDGLQAMLPMILGRVEHPSPSTTLLWTNQGPTETLAFPCAGGEYLQLWFGAKGAYEAFLERMGDEPSVDGYTADLVGGAVDERSARWAATLATRERSHWLRDFAGDRFRCEPVLGPGEALHDPHVRQIGLAVDRDDPELGQITALGPVVGATRVTRARSGSGGGNGRVAAHEDASPLLTGVHVLDLSAFLAGPVGPLVLAELGADVVKVEPPAGDFHRSMEPMYATGQRGKRAVALDLKAPDAGAVLARLFRWSDVVHHNSRVGVAERLGYDEPANPRETPNISPASSTVTVTRSTPINPSVSSRRRSPAYKAATRTPSLAPTDFAMHRGCPMARRSQATKRPTRIRVPRASALPRHALCRRAQRGAPTWARAASASATMAGTRSAAGGTSWTRSIASLAQTGTTARSPVDAASA